MKIKKETLIRTVITMLALLNSVLIMLGRTPLPWGNDELYNGFSSVLTVLTTLWSWWKNNSFTKEAVKADAFMEELKHNGNY